ncbi:MOSC domain-containing protein [Nocardioides koreensis]|uniref:MOSC domain-containing protein n=1 Tax=Nocardioides koreensis TaxID=433651 RepID=A0ABP5L216_9ACTN
MSTAVPPLGRLATLRRYPVKSLVGETLAGVHVGTRGVEGDRLWSVRDLDGKLGSGKSTRRFRRMDGLLDLTAAYDGDVPVIGFPDGTRVRGDDEAVHAALSAHVGRPVTLAREEDVSHFDDGPLHLVTTASLRHVSRAHGRVVDPRRLRPNFVLETEGEGMVEDGWVGTRIALGDELVVEIVQPMPRCVMVDLPQAGLPTDGGLLRTVTDLNQACLGVLATVVRPGTVAIGDEARPAP